MEERIEELEKQITELKEKITELEGKEENSRWIPKPREPYFVVNSNGDIGERWNNSNEYVIRESMKYKIFKTREQAEEFAYYIRYKNFHGWRE